MLRRSLAPALVALLLAGAIMGYFAATVPDDRCCFVDNYFLTDLSGQRIEGVSDWMRMVDGQLYTQLAADPFLRRDDIVASPTQAGYRYQRPLMPWLMALSTFGTDRWLVAAQAAWVLIGVAVSGWAVGELARRHGRPPMVGALVGILPGTVATVQFLGIDTVALAAATMAVLSYDRRRWNSMSVWLSLAVLARESSILVVFALAAGGWFDARWGIRRTIERLWMPVAVLTWWQAVLWLRFGSIGITGGFAGNKGHLWDWLVPSVEQWGAASAVSALVIGALVVQVVRCKVPAWLSALALMSVAASSTFGPDVWRDWLGFPRPLLPLSALALIVVLAPRSPAGVGELTLKNGTSREASGGPIQERTFV
jgi:hypothetical protein